MLWSMGSQLVRPDLATEQQHCTGSLQIFVPVTEGWHSGTHMLGSQLSFRPGCYINSEEQTVTEPTHLCTWAPLHVMGTTTTEAHTL